MKVDIIILGGQKCGTTALHFFLSKHPKIIASNPKEIDFFNYDFNYSKGIKYYHSFFKNNPFFANLRGYKFLEASPSYANGSLYVDTNITAERMFNYNSNLKLIFLTRNPIDRAFSAWNMFSKRFSEGKKDWWFEWFEQKTGESPNAIKRKDEEFFSFNLFIKRELECLNEGGEIECPVLDNGNYSKYLKIYLNIFKDNMFILENEYLERNTPQALSTVEKFLNLDNFNWSKFKEQKVFKGHYLNKIDEETLNLLKDFYEPGNRELLKITGINYL